MAGLARADDVMESLQRLLDRRFPIVSVDLVEVDIVGAQATRERPRTLGPGPIGKKTFVARTTSCRFAKSFSARPRTSSLAPSEYMSAVSRKLTPSSSARRMKGRLVCSSSTHSRHFGVPYVIVPRQTRETLRPVEPKRM